MELDDFEFRPLTDGLGFDKTTEDGQKTSIFRAPKAEPKAGPKKVEIDKAQFELADEDFTIPPVENTAPVSRSLKKMLDSLPPSVDFKEDIKREERIEAPILPEKQTGLPTYRPVQQPEVQKNFDVTLNNSLSQAFPKEETTNKTFFHQTVTPIPKFKEIETSFASAFIDGLFCTLLTSVFLVILVAITEVDIIAMLVSQKMGARAMFEISALFFGVTLVYFMLSRGMFGSTLGDYAFDVQLGTEKERSHIMYPFQVLFRTLIIMITGFVLVPLVSLGFGKDMAVHFSGLRLYNRQY